jgi:TPR repeat protein
MFPRFTFAISFLVLTLALNACTCARRTEVAASAPDAASPRRTPAPSAPRSCGSFEACVTACEAGRGAACYDASLFAFEARVDAGRDLSLVSRFVGLACDAGEGRGCMRAQKLAEAGRLLPAQCEGGDAEACELLFTWAQGEDAGTVGTTAAAKALALLDAACPTQPWACAREGSLLVRGRIGVTDIPRGVKLLERACDDGVAGACLEATLIFSRGLADFPADPARAAKMARSARELSAASE